MLPSERFHAGKKMNPGWQPPTGTRAARLRLFLLVGALMGVLVAMNEARKPTSWSWLWSQKTVSNLSGPVDTRVDPQLVYRQDAPPADDISVPSASSKTEDLPKATPPAARLNELDRGIYHQKQQAWELVWDHLNYDEKREFVRLLRSSRKSSSPGLATPSRVALIQKLQDRWASLLLSQRDHAQNRTVELSSDQKQLAEQVLSNLETWWNIGINPALEVARQAEKWTDQDRAHLAEVQQFIDAIALAEVRDDTVWRADERTAWFRLIEELQDQSAAELSKKSLGTVGFVQIFRQPTAYRGQIVTVKGTARMAYRVPAPPNDLNVQEYCLFWIQPEDGSNRPIVVYALRAPEGFPAITREQRALHEPITVTGYFFKRWVYRAADGLNSVPLIVAAAPTWVPPVPAPPTAQDRLAESLGPWYWVALLGASALLALVAVGIVRWIRGTRRTASVLAELNLADGPAAPPEPKDWEKLPETQSLEENLRHLERNPPKGT